MKFQLYSYQEEAIDKLKNGSILCGSVGSGKSRTAIAYFLTKVCSSCSTTIPLYIITTARKRDTHEWEEEFKAFDEIDLKLVSIDSWNNIKKYEKVKNAFFIFDEQRVIGSGSWVKSFLKITKSNQWILLSATPGDSWSDYIPVFIANGFYKNRTEFLERHAVYNYYTKYPTISRYLEPKRLVRLRDSILVKMNYIHEINKHSTTVRVDYDRVLYKRIWSDRWDIYEGKPIKTISKMCYLARKLINSDPSREEAVLEIVERHPKCIIFYNFDYELEILRNSSYPEGTEIAEWNGKKHEPIPKGDKWVYLVQYTAGAEGWNCITTDTIIFYSLNYSYKITIQASGRINRLNTPYTDLYYYYLRCGASIDMGISTCLRKKKNFNESKFIS